MPLLTPLAARRVYNWAFIALLGLSSPAYAQTFTRIADTSTTMPGGAGAAFNSFGPPVIEDSVVVFSGSDEFLLVQGVYYGNQTGALLTLVDRNRLLPGRGDPFGQIAAPTGFGGPVIENGRVVFHAATGTSDATGNPFQARGLYAGTLFQGDIEIVVENTLEPPQGPGFLFSDFTNPSIGGGSVAYRADVTDGSISRPGIYRTDPLVVDPARVFDLDPTANQNVDPEVQQPTFIQSLLDPTLTNGTLVFAARILQAAPSFVDRFGIYREDGNGGFTREVGADPVVPGTLFFSRLGGTNTVLTHSPLADGDNVLFYAEEAGSDLEGLYFLDAGGAITPVATTDPVAMAGTAVPNGMGSFFTSFDPNNYSVAGTEVVFVGRGSNGGIGIYRWSLGPPQQLIEVVSSNSAFDVEPGRPAANLRGLKLSNQAVDANGLIAFWAFFEDGTEAIYREGGPAGSVPGIPVLPTTVAPPSGMAPGGFFTGSTFTFDATVIASLTQYYDPEAAIGYDYEVEAGPGFESVLLPDGIGDGEYQVFVWDGQQFVFDGGAMGGVTYAFSPATDRFRVLGIEETAGLDPDDPLAFVSGLAFAADGAVTFTMTALVPEAGTLALLFLSAALIHLDRSRSRRR